jgi:predicted MPP superfamily phosphohydrolase
MTGSPSAEILFSWVHLSDIHAGHGSTAYGWDQQDVFQAILEDIQVCVGDADRRFPRPNAVLVTGDVAFSGGNQKRPPVATDGEYTAAAKWLGEVCGAIGIGKERVWMVPGNHDVDRKVDENGDIGRLIDWLCERKNRANGALDKVLTRADERAYLGKRMAAYQEFASGFASVSPPSNAGDENGRPLFWTATVPAPGLAARGLDLWLAGLNTALVGGRDDDKGRIHLGSQQLMQCLPRHNDGQRVVLVLSHHPVSWLADAGEVEDRLHKLAHVHLCGHVHEPRTETLRRGGGQGLVTIVAGAVHAERGKKVMGHGYSFGAICAIDGALAVRVWPRRWVGKKLAFAVDSDGTERNQVHVDHRLELPLPARGSGAGHPAEPGREPGERSIAAGAEPRSPAATPAMLSRMLLILDRTQQWERLVNRCMQAREHLAFLVHGDAAQDVGAFVHRVEQYLEEASQLPHRTWRVPLRSDGLAARTVADWDLHLRRATGFARLGLADALTRSAQNERLLLIFAEEPLKNIDSEQAAALVEFLRTRLPEQLRQARPRHPVHLLIAVEHVGPRTPAGDDPLVASIDAALHAAPDLDLEPLIELTFPTWEEVKAQIRNEIGPLAAAAMHACRERYDAVAALPGRSYRLLAGALAGFLETLPEAP